MLCATISLSLVRVFSCSVTLLQEKCFQVFLRTPRLVLLSRLSRRQLQWSSTFQLQLPCVSMWRQPQRSKTFLGSDEKRVITLTLVVSRKGDMSAQIIFGGKTSRVHPDAPPPDWCLYSHSENHWTSVTTLQEICQFMSDKVHGEKFIMLMDLCPVHCCRDFLDWTHEALPNMLLAFVPPGMTAQLQPLDRAYMRTVKNEIRKAAWRMMSSPHIEVEQYCSWTCDFQHSDHVWSTGSPQLATRQWRAQRSASWRGGV